MGHGKVGVEQEEHLRLSEKLDIPCPQTFNPQNEDELEALRSQLPLAIKPAVKENFFYATGAKAWRAQTMDELRQIYRKAARQYCRRKFWSSRSSPGMEATRFPTAPSFAMGRRKVAWSRGGLASILESSGERRPTWKALNCHHRRALATLFEGNRLLWSGGSRIQARSKGRRVQAPRCECQIVGFSQSWFCCGSRFLLYAVCRSGR